MNNISIFEKCANCGACYNICPKNAITVENGYPFLQVKVDKSICSHCGLCKNVCPVNTIETKQNIIQAYAAYNVDRKKIRKSSSGGVFIALAEYVLGKNGVVFGAAYDKTFRKVSIISTDQTKLDFLLRSKYVESRVNFSFRKIEQELKNGRDVLFCGAPCQVAGLKRFLQKEYDTLLTCDFSCGGMPSYAFYEEYLTYIEKKLSAEICEVNFRPKTYGWKNHAIKIKTKNGKNYCRFALSDIYFNCFIGLHNSVRDYCYTCNFANNHYSDIILADFWMIKKSSTLKDDDSGVSLILTNSPKGETLIQAVKKNLMLTLLDKEKASYNLVDKQPTVQFLTKRKEFIDCCKNIGFIKTAKKLKQKNQLNLKLKYIVKKFLGRVR